MSTGISRTAIVAIVTAAVVVTLMVIGAITIVKKSRQNRQALTELNAFSEEMNKGVKEKIGKEDTVEGSTEKAQQIQDALSKAADKSTGSAAQALRAIGRLMGAIKTHLASYEAAYSGFLSKGGLEPKSLNSEQSIDERIVLLKTFEKTNQEFADFLRSAEGKLRLELGKEGFPARETEGAVKGFLESANIDTLVAIRGTDSELCVAMFKYLQLLKTEWGKWKLNSDNMVAFQNDKAAEAFNGYAQQLHEVADRQAELQRKVLQAREQQGRALGKGSMIGTK